MAFLATSISCQSPTFGPNNSAPPPKPYEETQREAAISCPLVAPQQFESGERPDPKRAKFVTELLIGINRDFLKVGHDYQRASGLKKTKLGVQLCELAATRKSLFIQTMRRSPDAALQNTLSGTDRTTVEGILRNYIETFTTLEGTVEVLHADFFESSVTYYTLNTLNGRSIHLYPAGNLHVAIESRTKVRVKGIIFDNNLVFDATQSIAESKDFRGGIDVISQPGNPPVTGDQKTVILLVNFNDTPVPGFSKTEVDDFVSTKLAPYYAENSYNKISITADVFPASGWYTMSINHTCVINDIRDAAIQAADADVFFPNYSRLVILAPIDAVVCGWDGSSTIGKVATNTGDGVVTMSTAWLVSEVGTKLIFVAHELGHNFGNQHASFLNCGAVTITVDAPVGCALSQCGDYYDTMGITYAFHFNAIHKEYVGWFEPTNIQTVSASGIYVLEPIETATAGLKAIKISRPAMFYIYVEYRQPIGFDTDPALPVDANIYEGALLHAPLTAASYWSALLDFSPPGDPNSDITIPVGGSFTDPATGNKITVVSKTPTALTLAVDIASLTPTPTPAPTPGPTSTPTPTLMPLPTPTPTPKPANAPVSVCPEGSPFNVLCFQAAGISKVLGAIVSFFFALGVLITLFYLLWGAAKWINSGGDKAAIESARGQIFGAIVGLIVIFLAFLLINVLLRFFNIDLGSIVLPKL